MCFQFYSIPPFIARALTDLKSGNITGNIDENGKEDMMRKYGLLVSLIALVLIAGTLTGCDNRSQLEKDADAAAKKMSQAFK